MKAIIIEGKTDYVVLSTLFPQLEERRIVVHIAQGFSNVFAIARTFLDHGYEVLVMMDTDSHIPGNDNKIIVERILSNSPYGRGLKIVWMDPFIERVLDRAVPGFFRGNKPTIHNLRTFLESNRNNILRLDEIQKIKSFIDE